LFLVGGRERALLPYFLDFSATLKLEKALNFILVRELMPLSEMDDLS
jgi:hypothetical protein